MIHHPIILGVSVLALLALRAALEVWHRRERSRALRARIREYGFTR